LYGMARSLRQLGYNVNLDIAPPDSAPARG
jgi:hypothetical protein